MQVISNWGVKVPVSVTIMDTMNQHRSKPASADSQYNYVLIYSMTVVLDHIDFMCSLYVMFTLWKPLVYQRLHTITFSLLV